MTNPSIFKMMEVFDDSVLVPGKPCKLITQHKRFDGHFESYNCIIKAVSPTEITLFVAKLPLATSKRIYEIVEETYKLSDFQGNKPLRIESSF